MVGRKLALVRNGEIPEPEHAHPFVPDIEKAKHFTYQNIKKYEHLALVWILRIYVRLSSFLKLKYAELKTKIKIRLMKKRTDGVVEMSGAEANKFLKIISDYKHRIRHIKHKIKKEEGIE